MNTLGLLFTPLRAELLASLRIQFTSLRSSLMNSNTFRKQVPGDT